MSKKIITKQDRVKHDTASGWNGLMPLGAYWNGERYVEPDDPEWSEEEYERVARNAEGK